MGPSLWSCHSHRDATTRLAHPLQVLHPGHFVFSRYPSYCPSMNAGRSAKWSSCPPLPLKWCAMSARRSTFLALLIWLPLKTYKKLLKNGVRTSDKYHCRPAASRKTTATLARIRSTDEPSYCSSPRSTVDVKQKRGCCGLSPRRRIAEQPYTYSKGNL